MGSALYKLYSTADDPSDIPLPELHCPVGCLSFWSEEVVPGSITCRLEKPVKDISAIGVQNSFAFLYYGASEQRIGILALPSPSALVRYIHDKYSEYTYVLLSECEELFQNWPTYNGNGIGKINIKHICSDDRDLTDHPTLRYFLNVLFVKRRGSFVERIAFGQVYLGSWIKLKRHRRYFRMI
jgi:hypothetical protein